ncbi:MAG: hypothetical protein A2W85_02505 [Bacteroidetes bacterium GWF2_41_31]|nr:MAG: hypothetical protein A2W85_02505 [Bacteroidetes bacterium GWF2_41_31]
MKNQTRIRATEHKFSSDLWKNLDNLSPSNIEFLIESLEKYVSNGFFGAAAEISDTLQSSPLLKTHLGWMIRVELERMKRYYSLGYDNLLLLASNRVSDYLKKISIKDAVSDDVLLWKGTAIGHKGWITTNIGELKEIIQECIDIKDKFHDEDDKIERTCFIHALEGRLHCLESEYKKAELKFEEAIKIADENNFLRSSAHIKIIYSQHLASYGKWEDAVIFADRFLLNAGELQFKTHLLLRAFIIIFKAPENILEKIDIDIQYFIFRYQILLYAMGLSQSQNLNPLLAEAKRCIPKNKLFDLYTIDFREELRNRILDIASDNTDKGARFEKFIMQFYKLLGYDEVIELPAGYEALDLIAISKSPLGDKQFEGIQVKSGKQRVKTEDVNQYGKNLSDANKKLLTGKDTNGIEIKPFSVIHWYTIDTLYKPTRETLIYHIDTYYQGKCVLKTTSMDELVDIILSKAEILVQLVFNKEFGVR